MREPDHLGRCGGDLYGQGGAITDKGSHIAVREGKVALAESLVTYPVGAHMPSQLRRSGPGRRHLHHTFPLARPRV